MNQIPNLSLQLPIEDLINNLYPQRIANLVHTGNAHILQEKINNNKKDIFLNKNLGLPLQRREHYFFRMQCFCCVRVSASISSAAFSVSVSVTAVLWNHTVCERKSLILIGYCINNERTDVMV